MLKASVSFHSRCIKTVQSFRYHFGINPATAKSRATAVHQSHQLGRRRTHHWWRQLMVSGWWSSRCLYDHWVLSNRTMWRRFCPALRRRQHVLLWRRRRRCTCVGHIRVRWQFLLWRHLRRSGSVISSWWGQAVLARRTLGWLPRSQWLGSVELGCVSSHATSRGHRRCGETRSTLSDEHCLIIFAFLLGDITSTDSHHHADIQCQLHYPHCQCQERCHLYTHITDTL